MVEEFREVPGYDGMYRISNYGILKSFKTGKWKVLNGCRMKKDKNRKFYTLSSKHGVNVYSAAVVIMMAFRDFKPCGNNLVVDHIDNNCNNDILDNLQIISNRENASKDRKGYFSKYVGVTMNNRIGKFQSQIYFKNKLIYLGLFQSEEEASETYKIALKMLPTLIDVDKDSLSEFRLKIKNSIVKL